MAFVMYKGLMASEDVKMMNVSVDFQDGGVSASVKDGSFVVLGDKIADTTYSASGKDYNVYKAAAPTAVTDKVVVVDIAGVSQGSIAGNTYRIGVKLFNLQSYAGEPVRARRMMVGDSFYLGSDNFNGAVTVGQYAILEANKTTLAPNASIPESGFAVKIQESLDFTAGQVADGKLYLCEVVQL